MKTGLLRLLLLVLALAVPAAAQDPEFTVETTTFSVIDSFERPFLVERDQAWIGARVVTGEDQTANLKGYESLSASGIEYPLEGDTIEPLLFPVVDGVAKVQFVVFADPGKNPIVYRLTLVEQVEASKVERALLNSHWNAGNQIPEDLLRTEHMAPHANWEWMSIVAFVVVGAVLVYLWFGRSLFKRMLFHRGMPVGTAVVASNLAVLVGLASLAVAAPLLYFFPYVVWDQQYWIYLLVLGGYLLLLSMAYGLGLMMTKR